MISHKNNTGHFSCHAARLRGEELTSVSLEDMGFQAAVVGGLEGAQFAAERLVVSVVGLHVAVQA